MTIASQIQDYADGLEDAYDAVNDMQGTIPQDRNLDNLDTAIRTIPQNQGATYTAGNGINIDQNDEISVDTAVVQEKLTAGSGINIDANNVISATGVFYLNHSIEPAGSNFTLPTIYKDAALTETATMLEMYNAFRSRGAVLVWDDGGDPYNYPQKHVYTLASAYYDTDEDGDWIRFNVLAYCYTTPTGTWRDGDVFEIELDGGISDTTFFYRTVNPMAPSIPIFHAANNTDLFSGSAVTFYKGENGTTETASILDIYQAAQNKGAIIKVLGTNPAYSTSYYSVINACNIRDSNGSYYKFELVELTNGRTLASPKIALFMSTNGGTTTITPTILTLPTEAFTGATSSVAGTAGLVPAPAAGDNTKVLTGDGTWTTFTPELVEMSYGESNAWAKFIAAYNAKCIVYCRASSSSDPSSGAKTRKAFMAYVNDENNPTSVEFQYYRSVKNKTDSQQGDQTFIYELKNTNGGTWSVSTRENYTKILADSTLNKTYTQGTAGKVTLGAKTMTGATGSAAGTAGYVPAPTATDNTKFLKGDGTWASAPNISYSSSEIDTGATWIDGSTIYKKTLTIPGISGSVAHGITNLGAIVKVEGTVVEMDFLGEYSSTIPIPFYNAADGSGVIYSVTSTSVSVGSTGHFNLEDPTTYITVYYTKSS